MKALKNKTNWGSGLEAQVSSIEEYSRECEARVYAISEEFYNFSNIRSIQKKQIIKNFTKRTLNIFYAPVYILFKDLAFWFEEMGYEKPQEIFNRLPSKWNTNFHREQEQFLEKILFKTLDPQNREIKNNISKYIKEFSSRRAEKQDLNISFVSLIFGFFFFRKHGFSLTQVTQDWATTLANWRASSDFFMGEKVGGAFYSLFPQEPTLWHLLFVGVLVLVLFSLFVQAMTAFLFYIQLSTGLYKSRLKAMIKHVRNSMILDIIK